VSTQAPGSCVLVCQPCLLRALAACTPTLACTPTTFFVLFSMRFVGLIWFLCVCWSRQEGDGRRARCRWCLRTAWPREPRGFGQRMQEMMYSSDFATPLDARLAKLLWLASYAIVLAGRSCAIFFACACSIVVCACLCPCECHSLCTSLLVRAWACSQALPPSPACAQPQSSKQRILAVSGQRTLVYPS
jgi:hypothetical protein